VSKGLLSPRGQPSPLGDVGERSALIARQNVGRAAVRSAGAARTRARRSTKRRWLAIVAVVAAAGSAAAGGVHWLLTSPRFAIAGVEVRGASRVSAERVVEAAGIPARANIFRIDPTTVTARLQAVPEILRADVIRELPNRVTILVEERRPFTLVSNGMLHWLDEEGRLLGEEPHAVAPSVPVISGLSEAELAALRTEPGPKARAALTLIRSLLRSGSTLVGEISEIDMSGREGPVLYTVDGIEVRLGAEEWDERLARLAGVLAQIARTGEGVTAIDLRFRDQVVLRKGGQG
jgi:cell division protein FtsQ